jgi:hypothetical protein
MFGIHGEEFGAVLSDGVHHQLAGGDEAFLVREADSFAEADGFVSGFETRDPNDGGHYCIGFGSCGRLKAPSRAAQQFRNSGIWKKRAEAIHIGGIFHHSDSGLKLTNLLGEGFNIASGDEREYGIAVAILTNHVESARTD